MAERQQPQQIRVFLSSPGDVADERALARRLLKDELPYDPFLRGRVTFDVVSWDDPAGQTPMPATITPQEAVNRFGPKPSECDVVVVVLWSRLGTHLSLEAFRKPDGQPFLSGTEWEFEDAWKAWNVRKQPEILVYRRTEKPRVELDDPDLAKKRHQYELLEQFFGRFKNPDDSFRGGSSAYSTPTDFKEFLDKHLRHLLHERLGSLDSAVSAVAEVTAVPAWTGLPYPGLRPFTGEEASIFFGRGREVDALIARLRDPAQRFLAVVGASGTGKSSLVLAGLLPRLTEGAIEGSQHWPVLTITPGATGDDPLLALASEVKGMLPARAKKPPIEIATHLAKSPRRLSDYADALLADHLAGTLLVLFVDQFEELFTLVAEGRRRSFVEFLARTADDPRLRVLAALRADFLPQSMADPVLAPLLQAGTFPLGPPGPAALADIIRRPAEQAGLALADGLADEILTDAGGDPGALPLIAFCLEELYRRTAPEHCLTLDAYQAMGRLRGAIGRRASELLEEFREAEGVDLDTALPQVFRVLVHVDAAGKPARRRAPWDTLMTVPAPVPRLVEMLIGGRLLSAEDTGGRAVIMLAHEALLQEWPALREWLDQNRAQMQHVQRHLLLLAAPEAMDRQHAVKGLGEIGPAAPEVVPVLISALADAEKDVRSAAAQALGRVGPAAPEVVPVLISALADAEKDVRSAAAQALGRIGPAAPEVVPVLISALADAEKDVRSAAAQALGRIGPAAPEVVPVLISALADAEGDVRSNVAYALGGIGLAAPETVPALISALADADEYVRSNVAYALGGIGPAAPEIVPALISTLADAEWNVRWAAAYVLWRIGPAAAGAVPALITALADAKKLVRSAAAEALGQIGPAAAEAVPALISTLADAEGNVRSAAAQALWGIGPAAAEAVPALITALADAEKLVRSAAAQTLGQIGPAAAEAVPALITALADAEGDVRSAAAQALGEIGAAAAEAVPALTTALADEVTGVRSNAAEALRQIGPAAHT